MEVDSVVEGMGVVVAAVVVVGMSSGRRRVVMSGMSVLLVSAAVGMEGSFFISCLDFF